MEIWKDIKGYEGIYQISNLGNIKSLDHYIRQRNNNYKLYHGKTLKPYMTSTGYYKIDLHNGKKRKIMLIHRLIANAFIPNPDDLPEVNHIDGNKTNNNIDNLEWCTRSDNIKHSYKNKLHIHCPKNKPVKQININTGQIINTYKSINDAARCLDLRHESISACAKGVTNSYGGYKWEYKK